jgi:rubrerythrin
MDQELSRFIDEAITLELRVGDLYTIFGKAFPQDSEFWGELASEEQNHAAQLAGARDTLTAEAEFWSKLLPSKGALLTSANHKLSSLLRKCKESPPSRKEAFEVALELEQSAGELHYQRAVEDSPESETMKIFQELNNGDEDHARRIRAYMRRKRIGSR